MMISWVIGTLVLWVIATVALHREGLFPAVFMELTPLICLLVVYACLSGLGFFVGGFTVLWLIIQACRHINGAPFKVGDHAVILTGPKAGTVARVYELTRGQGGGLRPRLDLGEESRDKYRNIFDDYALLRHLDDNVADASCSDRTSINFHE